MYGAQDRALDSRHPIWFAGADLQLLTSRCPAQGRVCCAAAPTARSAAGRARRRRVYGLRLNNGGYVQATAMLTRLFGVLVRAELRDALVWLGDPMLQPGGRRTSLRDEVLARDRGASRRHQRADRRQGRVPAQRRVRGRTVDPERRVHVVGRHVLLKGSENEPQASSQMIVAAVAVPGGRGRAFRGPGKARACGRAPTAAEFAALKQRVDEQNELHHEADPARGGALRDAAQVASRATAAPGDAALPPPAALPEPPTPPLDPPSRGRRRRRARADASSSPPRARSWRPSPAASTSRASRGGRSTSTWTT